MTTTHTTSLATIAEEPSAVHRRLFGPSLHPEQRIILDAYVNTMDWLHHWSEKGVIRHDLLIQAGNLQSEFLDFYF
jgi:hypothetical protein